MAGHARLFVGNVMPDLQEEGLRNAFGQFGTVTDVYIKRMCDEGKPKNWSFVSFDNRQ